MRYTARVIQGRGEGRRIGIPTLNFSVPPDMAEPHGIYAGWIWIAAERHPAVFHWGPIPSYGIQESSLEGHLLDGAISRPPAEADLEMMVLLRAILNIPDTTSLVRQIEEDIRRAKEVLKGL